MTPRRDALGLAGSPLIGPVMAMGLEVQHLVTSDQRYVSTPRDVLADPVDRVLLLNVPGVNLAASTAMGTLAEHPPSPARGSSQVRGDAVTRDQCRRAQHTGWGAEFPASKMESREAGNEGPFPQEAGVRRWEGSQS